jgi:hypothetical protein
MEIDQTDDGKAEMAPTNRLRLAIPSEELLLPQDGDAHFALRADWQFTTADARVKLQRLYPQVE